MEQYRRRLPHWNVVGEPLFVTFRLKGSLPVNRMFPREQVAESGEAFVAMDRLLDRGECGPLFLKRPEVAALVVTALRDGEDRLKRYKLHSFVVMANHVHLLVTPSVPYAGWLAPLKGFTAHQANGLIGRSGAFWQDESYDRLVRCEEEFRRIQTYIENNPVKAGLVSRPKEFRWSSVRGNG